MTLPFSSALDTYLDYLTLQNRSIRTISEYRYDLQMFQEFLRVRGHSGVLAEVNDVWVERFLIYLRRERHGPTDKPLAPATINRKIHALSSLFAFLIKKRLYQGENPTDILDPIQTTKTRAHTYLTLEQARALLAGVRRGPYYRRDILMVEMMLLLGLRVSEVSRLNLMDVDLAHNTLHVHGKGNKERVLPLSPELADEIKGYLAFRRETFHVPKDPPALFLSHHGRRITSYSIQRIVMGNINRLGLNDGKEDEVYRRRITSHKLRHTFATLAVQGGVSILTLQKLLGHASVTTTQIYAEASDAQVREAVEHHPLLAPSPKRSQ